MSKEAMKLALEALIGDRAFLESDAPVEIWGVNDKAITALREALAQPEQEPYFKFRECEDSQAEQPAQQEYTSFAEWANDYVRANLHKLKPAQQEPVAWMQEMPTQEGETRSVRMTTLKEHATLEWDNPVPLYAAPPQPPAQQAPDYAWPTVQDYEADVGFKVNDAFQMGWDMARTTNDLFRQMGAAHDR